MVEFVLECKYDDKDININNIQKHTPTLEDPWLRKITVAGLPLYDQVCAHYNTTKWIHLHPQHNILMRFKLSHSDLEEFKRIGHIRCSSGRDFRKDDLEDFSTALINFFQTGLTKFERVFIRFSYKSFKNSFSVGLRPLTNLNDIFDALTSSVDLLKNLNQPEQEIFLMKWVDIEASREYRVFIIDGRLVGISQQHCHTSYDIIGRNEIVKKDAHLIYQYYLSIFDKLNGLNFQTVTLDIFIDDQEYVNLIEANPPSLWGPAGSSLFTEEDFLFKFNQNDKIFVRYK